MPGERDLSAALSELRRRYRVIYLRDCLHPCRQELLKQKRLVERQLRQLEREAVDGRALDDRDIMQCGLGTKLKRVQAALYVLAEAERDILSDKEERSRRRRTRETAQ